MIKIILLNKSSHLLFLQIWVCRPHLSPRKKHFWHPQVSPPFHNLYMFCLLMDLLPTWSDASSGLIGLFEKFFSSIAESWSVGVAVGFSCLIFLLGCWLWSASRVQRALPMIFNHQKLRNLVIKRKKPLRKTVIQTRKGAGRGIWTP